jgi:cytochrome c oxidase subunit 1
VNILFFPQHFLGMAGMPRRIPDYPDAYSGFNYISSLGAYLTAAGALLFFYIVWRTLKHGEAAPANQWGEGANTMEWSVPSPAPFHTHEVLPEITTEAAE